MRYTIVTPADVVYNVDFEKEDIPNGVHYWGELSNFYGIGFHYFIVNKGQTTFFTFTKNGGGKAEQNIILRGIEQAELGNNIEGWENV